jgi:hypothetical protein
MTGSRDVRVLDLPRDDTFFLSSLRDVDGGAAPSFADGAPHGQFRLVRWLQCGAPKMMHRCAKARCFV